MLEYDIEEAIILLTKNLNTANVNGDQLEDDLGYLSNQVIKALVKPWRPNRKWEHLEVLKTHC